MAVIGTDRFFERFPRHTQVTIHILPPILPKPGETPLALMEIRFEYTMAQRIQALPWLLAVFRKCCNT